MVCMHSSLGTKLVLKYFTSFSSVHNFSYTYRAQGSVMAWGCDPDALSADPYTGAHSAVYTSVAKIVAAGAVYHKAYLTLQEFFEKLRNETSR